MKRKHSKYTYIGTSGWSYQHWDKIFYPETLNTKEHLAFYAQFFLSVEINSTFYNTPLETTINNWFSNTPNECVFCVKASQYITHRKKLYTAEESVSFFMDRITPLKSK